MAYTLSEKESAKRIFILEGNLWKVLFTVALPLVLYNGISQFFGFFDALLASRISPGVVSTVAFVSQIQSMLSAIGAGLAIGGGIIIARYYGAGDLDRANRNINTLVFLALAIGLVILFSVIPFSVPFLRALRMPEDLIKTGTAYFMLETSMVVCIFLNTIYFAVEKAKGNTRVILYCTLLMLGIKFILTCLFVFVFHAGIIMLSVASLCAHTALTAIAFRNMTSAKNPFRLSLRFVDFSARTLKPLIVLSLPVFLEKFAFSFGKVIINSMSASYGSSVVGALGISNRIGGISTTPPIGFEEAEASLVSQNLGNGNVNRALGVFRRTFCINMIIGVFFFAVMSLLMEPTITLFSGGDRAFANEIRKIYNYERYATILLAASSSVMGLLYGFGLTRIAMILNITRLFVFRIPPLWIIQRWFTGMGSEGVGIAMMVSNGLVGVSATVVAVFLVRKIKSSRDSGSRDSGLQDSRQR